MRTQLVLLATDDHGQLAVIEATAPEVDTEPCTRIMNVRAGDLRFHAVPDDTWSFRGIVGRHDYTLTAGVGARTPVEIGDHGQLVTTTTNEIAEALAGTKVTSADPGHSRRHPHHRHPALRDVSAIML
jgi:hypothetical protein